MSSKTNDTMLEKNVFLSPAEERNVGVILDDSDKPVIWISREVTSSISRTSSAARLYLM